MDLSMSLSVKWESPGTELKLTSGTAAFGAGADQSSWGVGGQKGA